MEYELKLPGLEIELEIEDWRGVVSVVGIALVVAAVADQLRRPPEERTWHGRVFGMVPYDFRPPTGERARATFWNPSNPNVLVPHVFGVGWTVNFGALTRFLK